MSKDKGFTLVEMLIAIVIFSMISTLIFYAFSQSISLWERADREIEKLDNLIFLNTWMKDVFHSAENLSFRYKNKIIPIFFGESDRVLFISSNPLLDTHKAISLVQMEMKAGSLFYSEDSLYKKEFLLNNPITIGFEEAYSLLSNIEEGRMSYLVVIDGQETWTDRFTSESSLGIPRAVKMEFLYRGRKVELVADIFSDSKARMPFMKVVPL